MNLTDKGTLAFNKMFDIFRKLYIEQNTGCNENDIEKEFLNGIHNQFLFRLLQENPGSLNETRKERTIIREIIESIH